MANCSMALLWDDLPAWGHMSVTVSGKWRHSCGDTWRCRRGLLVRTA